MRRFLHIVGRELRLVLRQGSDSLAVIVFFLLAVSLFPFGVGPDQARLAGIAAGLVWVAALLAAMLSLDRLFQFDHDDGGLDLLVLAPLALPLVVAAKCLAHWLTTGLPLLIAAPVLAILVNMPAEGLPALVFAMLLGTPSLTLIGAVGAALATGARRGGVLISLLVLPLYVPVLIFGVAAADAAIAGMPARPHLLMLGAILAAALALAPWAGAAALRQAAE